MCVVPGGLDLQSWPELGDADNVRHVELMAHCAVFDNIGHQLVSYAQVHSVDQTSLCSELAQLLRIARDQTKTHVKLARDRVSLMNCCCARYDGAISARHNTGWLQLNHISVVRSMYYAARFLDQTLRYSSYGTSDMLRHWRFVRDGPSSKSESD